VGNKVVLGWSMAGELDCYREMYAMNRGSNMCIAKGVHYELNPLVWDAQ
jgi:gamma-glutamylcysteine synthetase